MSAVVLDRRDNSDLGLWGGNLVSGPSRDVSGFPGQKAQLGPGTVGGNLVSGPSRDVSGCLGQLGQW